MLWAPKIKSEALFRDGHMTELDQKKTWQLSPSAFQALLRWLDEGKDSEGQRFLEMRRRLVAYFDRKNCPAPDDLADETLNRIARRLEQVGEIESDTTAKYCYITARFVFLESLRARARDEAMCGEIQRKSRDAWEERESLQARERMLECLDRCAGDLDAAQRELVLSYYVGEERAKIENRRRLAKTLGITLNALSIRACRIRDKLEGCVKDCVSGK
jgi:hypothetical protein